MFSIVVDNNRDWNLNNFIVTGFVATVRFLKQKCFRFLKLKNKDPG